MRTVSHASIIEALPDIDLSARPERDEIVVNGNKEPVKVDKPYFEVVSGSRHYGKSIFENIRCSQKALELMFTPTNNTLKSLEDERVMFLLDEEYHVSDEAWDCLATRHSYNEHTGAIEVEPISFFDLYPLGPVPLPIEREGESLTRTLMDAKQLQDLMGDGV